MKEIKTIFDVKVPQDYKDNPPKRYKVNKAKRYIRAHNMIDKCIRVNKYGFCTDQYSRLVALKEMFWNDEIKNKKLNLIAVDENNNSLYMYTY